MICPRCHRAYTDRSYGFCPDDGARLVQSLSAAPPAQPTRQFGAILEDRYAIQGFIGAGGMSRVYLAADSRTKEQVAIKILNRSFAGDRAQRERFLRELEVAGRSRAPQHRPGPRRGRAQGRVPIHRARAAHRRVARRPAPPRGGRERGRRASADTAKAASALALAHAAGVIHRDVKPDNLFLVRSPGGPRVLKMMDFGFAKLKTGPATAAGLVLGTVPYMAPEQALADPIDGRTDVYALGVTMFRMLAGQLPFSSPDDVVVVAQHACTPAPGSARSGPASIGASRRWSPPRSARPPRTATTRCNLLLEDVERILGVRPGEPIGVPLRKTPDVYAPVNPAAREAPSSCGASCPGAGRRPLARRGGRARRPVELRWSPRAEILDTVAVRVRAVPQPSEQARRAPARHGPQERAARAERRLHEAAQPGRRPRQPDGIEHAIIDHRVEDRRPERP